MNHCTIKLPKSIPLSKLVDMLNANGLRLHAHADGTYSVEHRNGAIGYKHMTDAAFAMYVLTRPHLSDIERELLQRLVSLREQYLKSHVTEEEVHNEP